MRGWSHPVHDGRMDHAVVHGQMRRDASMMPFVHTHVHEHVHDESITHGWIHPSIHPVRDGGMRHDTVHGPRWHDAMCTCHVHACWGVRACAPCAICLYSRVQGGVVQCPHADMLAGPVPPLAPACAWACQCIYIAHGGCMRACREMGTLCPPSSLPPLIIAAKSGVPFTCACRIATRELQTALRPFRPILGLISAVYSFVSVRAHFYTS